MARPLKNNADYFPHDAGMRNDAKIKVLRRKYSFKGYAIWCMLLEALTNAKNFKIELTDLNIELFSGDFDCDPSELKEIINYCASINLLQIQKEKNKDVLLCKNLKKRFEELLLRRKRDRERRKVKNNNDPQKQKVKKEFVPPSREEVIEFFEERGYKKEAAIKAYDYYNVSNWVDKEGKPVKNWKRKMINVWFKDENRQPSIPELYSNTLI